MQSNQATIAVDMLGGDYGLRTTLPAVVGILKRYQKLHVILVGPTADIEPVLSGLNLKGSYSILPCSTPLPNTLQPSAALRYKPPNSMCIALNAIHDVPRSVVVSAGDTGALMALAKRAYGMRRGVKRPALAGLIPNVYGQYLCMLDLGANLEVKAKQLLEFAHLGVDLMQQQNIKLPKVALLNIGIEPHKGPKHIQDAAKLLSASGLNYIGFIEPNRLLDAEVDVVVSDGCMGNVALKAIEGMAHFYLAEQAKAVGQSALQWQHVVGLQAGVSSVASDTVARFNPSELNGALLLGLQKAVIKSHGSVDSAGFTAALAKAVRLVAPFAA